MSIAETIASLCSSFIYPEGATFAYIAVPFIISTFIGSFSHCAWMCGPFVTMQISQNLSKVDAIKTTEFTRIKGAALLPYHLGRITTYTILGAIAGSLGTITEHVWRPTSSLLIFLAGIALILSISPLKNSVIRHITATFLPKNLNFSMVKKLFDSPTGFNGYFIGISLGFLPCGMVYAALAVAAATASPITGATLMFLFGFSTIPALFFTALLSTLTFHGFRKKMLSFSRVITLLTGCWLCLLGLILFITSITTKI
ncbi:MAG: sulfite exporter TauE/SafE family protein [Alphaproteobacteria bacterium]|nr:sulfite exporter TauE/SafE family protein [Alphaproteobacteria bacterium]MDD9920154.1 sulfite exporter TauE/SafE family protein [Alphaproteobacteria bacterium]